MRATVRLAAIVAALVCALHVDAYTNNSLTPVAVGPDWKRFEMVVSLHSMAMDGFERPGVHINGMSLPALEVTQGDMIYVNVFNKLPKDFPSVYDGGFTIHWHGLKMLGEASWYDGVAYSDMCPIMPGTNFTYAFKVVDNPGTYFYHDHLFAFKADGLEGPLIIHAKEEPWKYDGEFTVFLKDFWHTPGNVQAMSLNRPLDAAMQTAETRSWRWVGNPQSILINGKGFYGDCLLYPGAGSGPTPPVCNATVFTVPPGRSVVQPWASDTNPGTTHESFTVEAGKTYRFRIISGSDLMYLTTCFEGHNVTVIALDTIPIEPFNTTCVDNNLGQRVDVLLTANQVAANYWISIHPQFRIGTPSGYSVLNYQGANVTFPSTPTPQIAAPWSIEFQSKLTMKEELLTLQSNTSAWYQWETPYGRPEALAVEPVGTKKFQADISQPLFNGTGILRWALNNVMTPTTPVCDAFRKSIQMNPDWIEKMQPGLKYGDGQKSLNMSEGPSGMIRVVEAGNATEYDSPFIGLQFAIIEHGEVVDVVLQNRPADWKKGDYRAGVTRTAQEQHPIHLHGHHFWVLGMGLGVFDWANESMVALLNLKNPIQRDTATLYPNAWTVIRFNAKNPGAWPMHCHILWHHFMGQQFQFIESADRWTKQPKGFPKCPRTCPYNTNPFTTSFLEGKYGNTGYTLP